MAKGYPINNNFTSGEISPLIQGRPDIRGFKNGAETIKNLIVDSRGGVFRRGGFKEITATKYNTGKVRTVPFIFNDTPDQSYVIEFGNRYIRIVRNHALLTRDQEFDSVDYGYNWGTDPDTPSSQDDLNVNALTGVTATLNFRIEIDGDTPDTFKWSVDGAGSFVASTVGIPDATNISLSDGSFDGTITINFDAIDGHQLGDLWDTIIHPATEEILIGTPYAGDDLDEIRFRESADVLYLTHKSYAPHQLRRKAAKDWEFIHHPFAGSPFEAQSTITYRVWEYTIGDDTLQHTPSGFEIVMGNKRPSFVGDKFSGNHSGRIAWSGNTDDLAPDAVPSYVADNFIDGDQFIMEYRGLIDIEETGTYYFMLVSTGSCRFQMDNGTTNVVQIASDFKTASDAAFPTAATEAQNPSPNFGSITFTDTGQYKFELQYTDDKKAGGAVYGLALYWKKPSDNSYGIVPGANFTDREVSNSVSTADTELWDYDPTALDDETNGEAGANFSGGFPQNESGMDFLFTVNNTYSIDKVGEFKQHGRIAWSTADSFGSVTGDKQPAPSPSYVPKHGNIGWLYSGWLYVPVAGDYYFSIDSNDSADLAIKVSDTWTVYADWYGAHNINGDGTDGFQFQNASVNGYNAARSLTKGWHQIRVRLFSGGFHSAIGVAWSKPSDRADKYNAPASESEWVVIPHSNLGTDKDNENNPRLVSLFQNRLVYASSLKHPQRIWFSKTGNYDDFTEGAEDTDGFFIDIADDQVNAIQWLTSGRKLLAGTISSEHAISGKQGSITPDDREALKQSSYGSEFIDPVTVDFVTLFVQRNGSILRELSYSFDVDGYRGRDDSILSEHLYTDKIRELHVQRVGLINQIGSHAIKVRPVTLVWVLTESGLLRGITYELEQEVIASHQHDIGGDANTDTGRKIDSMCVIPGKQTINGTVTTGDELYVAVTRNSGANRYIEYLDTQSAIDGAGGSYKEDYVSELKPMPVDFMIDEQNTTLMVSKKQWSDIHVKFNESAGSHTIEHAAVGNVHTIALGASIVTQDERIFLLGIDDKGQLIIKHTPAAGDGSDSYPLHILAITGVVEINAY